MRIIHRYASACVSSNLKNDLHNTSTDVLASVALSSDIGHLLYRLKFSNDASVYNRLLDVWVDKVTKKGARRGWSHKAKRVAITALQHWINDACPACSGRGRKRMPNAPVLSDDLCDLCNGNGKKTLKCDDDIYNLVKNEIEQLDYAVHECGSAAIKKLADEINFC